MKLCPRCKLSKPEEAFAKCSSNKDGLQGRCRTCMGAASKNWNATHPEKHRESVTKWYATHPEEGREQRREANKRYEERHYRDCRDRRTALLHRRRAIIRSLTNHFTPEEFKNLCEEYRWRCFYCNCQLNPRTVIREHFIPIAKGGTNDISNIVPSCKPCNDFKGARLLSFQDLMNRPGAPKPPEVLLCIDPGHCTGWASFIDGKPHKCGQIMDTHLDPGKLGKLLDRIQPTLVVFEEFVLYPWRMKQQSWSDLPTVQIIGVLKYLCAQRKIPTHTQGANVAKGFCTDQKLKSWNMWVSGKRHSMDAIRHGCFYLLFSKQPLDSPR